jgi:uncharacterized protein
MSIEPKKSSDRIQYLDILRGIAILFIFLANIYVFSGWYFMDSEVQNSFSGGVANKAIKAFTAIFVDGKWYSIFSILFGIGFVIQYENAKKKGIAFPIFFSGRMLGLLLFGLIHLFLIWMGDILTLYALLGFVLILFRDVSNKNLLRWSVVLLLLPIFHLVAMIGLNSFYPLVLQDIAVNYFQSIDIVVNKIDGQMDANGFVNAWLNNTNWKEVFLIHLGSPLIRLMLLLIEGRFFKVLACFLIGIWAGRQILQNELLENYTLLRNIVKYGFLIGLPMNILLFYGSSKPQGVWTLINSVTYALGVVPLACAYAAGLALLLRHENRFLKFFAPVGQMALSNYILQSIIAISLFYGIGLGLAFDIPLWQIFLIVIFIVVFQILLSRLWLQKFRYGPLEWLWRMMTYRKWIKITR